MQILTTWLVGAALFFMPADALLVQTVIDGDTIRVASVGRVRLLGIEAPKFVNGLTPAQPLAQAAKQLLESLVLRRYVRLERETAGSDFANRRLVYVMTDDGQFVNAVMVREGLARVTVRRSISRLGELKEAEADAQTLRKGIWGERLP